MCVQMMKKEKVACFVFLVIEKAYDMGTERPGISTGNILKSVME